MTTLRMRLLGCDCHDDTMLFRRTGVLTEEVRTAGVPHAFCSLSYEEDLGNAEQPYQTQKSFSNLILASLASRKWGGKYIPATFESPGL